jgi:hypothetical protein
MPRPAPEREVTLRTRALAYRIHKHPALAAATAQVDLAPSRIVLDLGLGEAEERESGALF